MPPCVVPVRTILFSFDRDVAVRAIKRLARILIDRIDWLSVLNRRLGPLRHLGFIYSLAAISIDVERPCRHPWKWRAPRKCFLHLLVVFSIIFARTLMMISRFLLTNWVQAIWTRTQLSNAAHRSRGAVLHQVDMLFDLFLFLTIDFVIHLWCTANIGFKSDDYFCIAKQTALTCGSNNLVRLRCLFRSFFLHNPSTTSSQTFACVW